MHTTETFGQKVARLRIGAGLTQRQLADSCAVPLSTLQNWEIDRREPNMRSAVRLAKALGVTVEELADSATVEEVGKSPRPAGPSKRIEPPPTPLPKKRKPKSNS